ncbi:MAG: hypothetical protein ACXIT4_04435 [Erythrobacter sp.]
MIGRIVWLAVVLFAALITMQLQLDRESARRPSLALLVVEPLRGNAQAVVAADALAGDNPARALAEARKLVAQRPVPAESLTALASAQFNAGQIEEAALTIQIAARRGWREPFAQQVMAQFAIEAEDMSEAARRYTALFLSQSTPNELLIDLGAEVLAEPGGPGRTTLVEIVSEARRWHSGFLRRGMQVMPPDAFAEITIGSIERGAVFDCSQLEGSINWIARSDLGASNNLRAAAAPQCPALSQGKQTTGF